MQLYLIGKSIKGDRNEMPKNIKYKADLLADLRDDLGYAGEYLSAAYADSQDAFLVALRDVAEAQKGVGRVAKLAKVNRENLYRTLSRHGNPTLSTVTSVLDVLGLAMRIVPQEGLVAAHVGSDPIAAIGQTAVYAQGPINSLINMFATSRGWTFGPTSARGIYSTVPISTTRNDNCVFLDTCLPRKVITQQQVSDRYRAGNILQNQAAGA
jgi:probable addiction module antidote protein